MYDKIASMLKKPLLWQRSTEPFWDDEHISKGMLEAHLNPGTEAASRNPGTIARSVQWLSTVIPAGGRVLDLGCGPGLYTKRLSEMGYHVTGIDFSKRSIAHAKGQDAKTEYIYMNYLELDYEDEFDAITLIYCDYAALTASERQTILHNVRRALKPGGVFIFDVFTEAYFKGKSDKTFWSVHEAGGFWSAAPYIYLGATHLYENYGVSVDQHVIITNEQVHEYLVWDTAYTVQSLSDEVTQHGFHVKGVFGDVCGSPREDGSETLCCVAAKQVT